MDENEQTQAIEKIEPSPTLAPIEQTRMSLQQSKERLTEIRKFCHEILVEGPDFSTIPGCGDKKVLKKPGGEKLAQFLNVHPDYIDLKIIENFDDGKELFFYRYKCNLHYIPDGKKVGSGIGSCNSKESKYRWRQGERRCPVCNEPTIKHSKWAEKEPQKAWYCYGKIGGCGAQFHETETKITDQKLGRVPNPDVCDQVNTIDKIGQKRAFMAAIILTSGVGEEFTQDLDDFETPPDPPEQTQSNKPATETQKPVEKAAPKTKNPGNQARLQNLINDICVASNKDKDYTFKKCVFADGKGPLEYKDFHLLTAEQLDLAVKRGGKILDQLKEKDQSKAN